MSIEKQKRSSEATTTPHSRVRRTRSDPDFYRKIGKAGGDSLVKKIGPDGFRLLGLKGGAATKQKYGSDHYKRIGQQGGLNKGKNRAESAT